MDWIAWLEELGACRDGLERARKLDPKVLESVIPGMLDGGFWPDPIPEGLRREDIRWLGDVLFADCGRAGCSVCTAVGRAREWQVSVKG